MVTDPEDGYDSKSGYDESPFPSVWVDGRAVLGTGVTQDDDVGQL